LLEAIVAPIKKDKTLAALEAVHTALKPLTAEDRQRVLASVRTLLEIPSAAGIDKAGDDAADVTSAGPTLATPRPLASTRPLAIRELIQDKKPDTHPELITLFAYYREKHENLPTFSRADLERYYTASRENPPKNYDRDFVKAITRGWIHEDNSNSYITSKGIEAVESGFAGATGQTKSKQKSKAGKKRS